MVVIQTQPSEMLEVSIFDVLGKKVLSQKSTNRTIKSFYFKTRSLFSAN